MILEETKISYNTELSTDWIWTVKEKNSKGFVRLFQSVKVSKILVETGVLQVHSVHNELGLILFFSPQCF